MRCLVILAVLVGGCGGGQSIGPNACESADPQHVCCTEDTQCDNGNFSEFCLAPGAFAGCGACNSEPSTCTIDNDCKAMGATMICQPRTCACDFENDCVAGCTSDAQCGEAQACNLTSNHCEALACAATPDCPVDFACTDGHCIRATCETDNDCDAFCVGGACYQQAGVCTDRPV